jgi:glycoside/pentoside/hexuronide:cation symporter, GPH family
MTMIDFRQGTGSINRNDILTYSMGSFGTGVFSTVPSVLLLYFCTETLHIAVAIAGAIMLIPKLWSIIWDPLVGNWSDRSQHRWGRRRPFMIAGNVGMVVAFVLLFSGPILSPFATVVWVGAAYFALATLYSLFAVPYIAIPAEISPDQASLSSMVSARMMTSMVGILVGAAGAPLLVSWGGGGRDGYGLMGWIIAGACLVIMAAPVFMIRRELPCFPICVRFGPIVAFGDWRWHIWRNLHRLVLFRPSFLTWSRKALHVPKAISAQHWASIWSRP